LSNKSFMKYNYLTIFYISKGRGKSNFYKNLYKIINMQGMQTKNKMRNKKTL